MPSKLEPATNRTIVLAILVLANIYGPPCILTPGPTTTTPTGLDWAWSDLEVPGPVFTEPRLMRLRIRILPLLRFLTRLGFSKKTLRRLRAAWPMFRAAKRAVENEPCYVVRATVSCSAKPAHAHPGWHPCRRTSLRKRTPTTTETALPVPCPHLSSRQPKARTTGCSPLSGLESPEH